MEIEDLYIAFVVLNSLSRRKLVCAPARALQLEFNDARTFFELHPDISYKQQVPVDFVVSSVCERLFLDI